MPDTIVAASLQVNTGNAAKDVNEVNDSLKDVKKTAGDTNETLKKTGTEVKGTTGHFSNFKNSLSAIPGPAKAATEGLGGINSAFNVLKANPIIGVFVLIAALVVGLFQKFKNMEAVSDSLGKAFGVLSSIFDTFLNKVLTPLIDAFTFLVDLFTNSVIGVLDALGVASKENANRVGELVEALDDLEDAEKDSAIATAEASRRLAEAKEIAADANVPIKDRIKALKEAGRIEKEEADKVVKINQTKAAIQLELMARELGARDGLIAKIKEGTLESLKAARAELAAMKNVDKEKLYAIDAQIIAADNAAAQSSKIQKKVGKEITALEKEEADKRLAIQKEYADKRKVAREKELAEEKKYQQLKSEFLNKQKLADLKNEFDKEAEKVRQDFKNKEEEIKRLNISNAKKKELTDLHNKELLAQLTEINNKRLEKQRELQAKIDEENKKQQEKELEDAAKKAEDDQKAEDLRIENDKKRRATQADLAKELADKGLTPEQLELQTLQETYEKKYALALGNEELLLELKKQFNDEKQKLDELHQQQQLESVSGSLGKISEVVGKQTVAGKGLAVAEATINTLVAGTNALKAIKTAKSPIEAIAGIATMAAVIAAGFKTVKAITAVQVPGGGAGGNVSAPSAPAAPIAPRQTSTSLDPNTIQAVGNAAGGGTNQNFILDSTITSNAERSARLTRAARLG